jgi:hypothetical protein
MGAVIKEAAMAQGPLLILVVLVSMVFLTNAGAPQGISVHTVFTTECNQYFNWQVSTPPLLPSTQAD